MSDRTALNRVNATGRSRSFRLPIWVPPLLLIASGIIGLLLAIPAGSIGLPYLISFATAAIVGTLFVVPRGLTVTVAQQPLFFTVITPLVTWFTAEFAHQSVGGASASTPSTTRLITAAYPVIQYFPWMIMIPLVCSAIAIWRYLDLTRTNAKSDRLRRKESKRRAQLDAETTRVATRAHRRLTESDQRRRPGQKVPAHERDAEVAAGSASVAAASSGAGAVSSRTAEAVEAASAGASEQASRSVDAPGSRGAHRESSTKQSAAELIKAAEQRRLARAAEDRARRERMASEAEQRRVAAERRAAERRVADPRRAASPRRAARTGDDRLIASARPNAAEAFPSREYRDRLQQRPDNARLWGSQTSNDDRPASQRPAAPQRRSVQPRQVQSRQVQEWPPRLERPRHAARGVESRRTEQRRTDQPRRPEQRRTEQRRPEQRRHIDRNADRMNDRRSDRRNDSRRWER